MSLNLDLLGISTSYMTELFEHTKLVPQGLDMATRVARTF